MRTRRGGLPGAQRCVRLLTLLSRSRMMLLKSSPLPSLVPRRVVRATFCSPLVLSLRCLTSCIVPPPAGCTTAGLGWRAAGVGPATFGCTAAAGVLAQGACGAHGLGACGVCGLGGCGLVGA